MTLSTLWLRKEGEAEELVIATDSRLRAGRAWDCCPKVFILPRGDSAICFAGETDNAYPLLTQAVNTVQVHPPALDRSLDLYDLLGHLVRVFNHMRNQIHDLPVGVRHPGDPMAEFLLGGYSWRKAHFQMWRIYYEPNIAQFTYQTVGWWGGQRASKRAAFVGDHIDEAKRRLLTRLREKAKLKEGGLDMEPFEVLRDMIRESSYHEIGGPPQIVKVYRHLNSIPFGVLWPNARDGGVAVNGRPFLDYEATRLPLLDPDSLRVTHTYAKVPLVREHPSIITPDAYA